MKRKFLLTCAAIAALFVGTQIVSAREDVTSKLTDASLSDEATNWALSSTSGNHNWDGTNKYHESWHNTFTISQTVSGLDAGYYEVSIQAVNSVLDATTASLTAKTSDTNTSTAYIKHCSGGSFADIAGWMAGDKDFARIYTTIKVTSGESLTISFGQTNAEQWIVYGQVQLTKLTDTEGANAIALQNVIGSQTNWCAPTNKSGTYRFAAERYSTSTYGTGKIIYQQFTGLPTGNYEVTSLAVPAEAWSVSNYGDDIAQYYVGSANYGISVISTGSSGYTPKSDYLHTGKTISTDGTLEVGIKNIASGGNWYTFAVQRITYLGEDLSDYETPFADAKTLANAVDQTKDMNSTVLSDLKTAITNYGSKSSSDFSTVADIKTAINALNNTAIAASASIAYYDNIATQLAKFDEAGQTAFKATTEGAAYVAKTYTDADLASAYATAALSQTKAGADMSLGILNNSFELGNMNKWTDSSTGMTWNLMTRASDGDPIVGTYWYEKYAATGKIDLSQKVTVLKAGKYQVGVRALDQESKLQLQATTGSTTYSTTVTSSSAADYTVDIALDANSELKLGIYSESTSTNKWVAFDNFTLTYLSSEFGDVTAVTGDMNAAIATAQTNAIAAYNANKSVATYNAAVSAIEAAQASADKYADIAAKLATLDEAGQTAFKATTVGAAYDDKTYTDADCTEAFAAAAKAQTTDGAKMTLAIKNPSFETGDMSNWTNTDCGGINNTTAFAMKNGTYFAEKWVAGGSTLADGTLSQKITGLPTGKYTITVDAHNVQQSGDTDGAGFYVFANNDKTEINTLSGETRTVSTLTANGTIILGVQLSGCIGNWIAYDNFTLTYDRALTDDEKSKALGNVIMTPDCSDNTFWPGTGRTTTTMTAYDDTERIVFMSNTATTPGYKVGQRSQEITLPYAGTYKLTGYVNIPAETGYVNISVDDLVQNTVYGTDVKSMYTVGTDGAKTSTVNEDASGWVALEIYFDATAGDKKTIYLNISKGDAENVAKAYLSGLKLEYKADGMNIALAETGKNPAAKATASTVTLAKSLTASKYNTLCIPFDYPKPAEWTILEMKDASASGITFEEATSIEAGKAYLVTPSSACTQIMRSNVTVNTAASVESTVSGYRFIGTMAPTAAPTGSYVLQTQGGVQQFYIVDSSDPITVPAYKAYLTAPANSGAKSLAICFDGEENPTAVNAVNALVNGTAKIYDINGRQLPALRKGVNIVNGVKVVVK